MLQGIWIGMLLGTLVQTVVLTLITLKSDWDKQVRLAQARVNKWANQAAWTCLASWCWIGSGSSSVVSSSFLLMVAWMLALEFGSLVCNFILNSVWHYCTFSELYCHFMQYQFSTRHNEKACDWFVDVGSSLFCWL